MPQIQIPITTYLVRRNKPNKKFGSPSSLPVSVDDRVYARVPLDKVPLDGTITSAVLRIYEHKPNGTGGRNLRVYNLTGKNWNSSIRWNKQPTTGTLQGSQSRTAPANMTPWDIDITAWAVTRSKLGLRIDSSTARHFIRGSAAAKGKPVLIVDYVVLPDQPGSLVPDGGAVSVDRPILTYEGDEEMVEQLIEFSTDEGETVAYATSWLPATEGRFDPATDPATPTATEGGPEIFWRVRTNGPKGISEVSDWASYTYAALPLVTVINPGATSPDGSPTLQWTVEDDRQDSWKAELTGDGKAIQSVEWRSEPETRDWTPSKGVKVPDGHGRFTLQVLDDVSPRVAAENAPSWVTVTHDYTTTLDGSGAPIDSLSYTFDDPIPTFTGTRAAGIPDEVSLYRDDVQVPLWSPVDETYYPGWAPGADFFTGTEFTLRDYTADLRHEHTWEVRVRVNGEVSEGGPSVTDKSWTQSLWLVDPRTDVRVEVLGYNEVPVVEQTTEESSILHTPLNDGLIVEPVRRRIVRTTRAGTVSGTVLNEDEASLLEWVEGDSSLHYRLIFGKVNWSVIIGDYSPADVFYGDNCGPDRVLVAMNWWQRLEDD